MKDRIALSKLVDVGNDLSASAFRPNYIYLFDDAVQVYFEPTSIPPQRVAYPNEKIKDDESQIVMPQKVADDFKAALLAVLEVCKGRLENPYVRPTKEDPAPDVKPEAAVDAKEVKHGG